jgi:hypothetical protein
MPQHATRWCLISVSAAKVYTIPPQIYDRREVFECVICSGKLIAYVSRFTTPFG